MPILASMREIRREIDSALSSSLRPRVSAIHIESTIACRHSQPSSSASSMVSSSMSRDHAQIASWHSILPKRALRYPVYPKQQTRIHLSTFWRLSQTSPFSLRFDLR